MQLFNASKLAIITPIQPGEAKRIMRFRGLLMHNLMFVVFQTAWMLWGMIGCKLAFETNDGVMQWMGINFLLLCLLWLLAQVVIVFAYPEWPMNLWLSSRLRRAVGRRRDRAAWAADGEHRVVELVPRERWNALHLDTAIDLMLIRVDSRGVQMEGDCHRYHLPSESIIDVQLESTRPSGWFTDTHMVMIYARTADGPVELPISFRDHSFGCLRSTRRRAEALELMESISRIACGGFDGPIIDSTSREDLRVDIGGRKLAPKRSAIRDDHETESSHAAVNPYQSPTMM